MAFRHRSICFRSRRLKTKFLTISRVLFSRSAVVASSSSTGEQGHLHEAKVSEGDVNKRLTSHELSYDGKSDRILFSANQLGVNRPVEDRWSAFQFGSLANNSLNSGGTLKSTSPNDSPFGGTVFSVIDGHGGQACAHAYNLLHGDYLVSGLLPNTLFEQALCEFRHAQEVGRPQSISQLTQRLWTKPEAVLTVPTEHIGEPGAVKVPPSSTGRKAGWAPWGSWGPLPSSVWDVHVGHMQKLFGEMLSTHFDGSGTGFDTNSNGDIVDNEGFVVASAQLLHDALLAFSSDPSDQHHLLSTRTVSTANNRPMRPHHALVEPVLGLDSEELLNLQDEVSLVGRSLRDSLRRLDLDVATTSLPSVSGPVLDKAMLRIAFSGCVSTSAYLPESMDQVYILQVGDCGAVMGSHVSGADPESLHISTDPVLFDADSWHGKLLVDPHIANNEAEVQRLKSEHPIHESTFLLRDDRLLGTLMPLRAFGDIRFKWSLEELRHVAHLLDLPPNYSVSSSFYNSPPYLVSTPQVTWRPLLPHRDYFLILATDGLWDMLSPDDATRVVAKHWFDYDRNPALSGPGDTAATRLVRTALGGEEMDSQQISVHFSMPATVARYYRDDITAIVIYLPAATQHLPSASSSSPS